MKKLMILIAMFVIAGVASADVMNGDFSFAPMGEDNSLDGDTDMDQGWFRNVQASTDAWTIIAGEAVRGTDEGASHRGFGQMFTHAGSVSFVKFDYDAFAGNGLQVILVGYTGSGSYNSNDGFRTANTAIPTGDNYTITTLVNETIASGSGSIQYDFTAGAYDNYAIKFLAKGDDGAATVDNVTVVPEPATVGMLGLGALVALAIRRIRA